MSKNEVTKRYILFIISLFFAALGVAFTKHAELGVSPTSSVANVMSCKFSSLSLGTWLIIWNCILILGQIVILRKQFQLIQLLQIPLSFLFGWFTDFGMWLVSFIPIYSYPMRIVMVLVGIVILGFGVSLSVIAGVIMNSAEAFVKAVSDMIHKEFGNVKIVFDVVCVIISLILSLVFFNFSIVGTREGTIITALLTGVVVKFFCGKLTEPLNVLLCRKSKKKQYLYFWNLLILSLFVLFTGCEQKEQTVEESPDPTGGLSVVETPLPVENQLFYAEGMESISINEKELTAGKEVDMTVQTAEGEELYCRIAREKTNPQLGLSLFHNEESGYEGFDLAGCLGDGFRNVLDEYNRARPGFDYQMAWYDFNRDGKKELIVAGGDKQETLSCSVIQVEVENWAEDVNTAKYPKMILEIQEGVRAYVNDNNEICVVDAENHISKLTVPL